MNILETFHGIISTWIDPDGVTMAQGIVIRKAVPGEKPHVEMLSMDLSPEGVYRAIKEHLTPDLAELVFGMDRFCRPDQGTTLGDCFSVSHFDGERWKFGIIEYQNEPRQVLPINWHNAFWCGALETEAAVFLKREIVK